MRKLALAAVAVIISTVAIAQNGRLFDQPMKIRNFNVRVMADCITATTFIEIEFYNKNDQEMEGAYFFRLKPGQVITSLQLDLHGKYRDGTIEERWKAANAYNTIVGKRIDPALLQWTSQDQYKLSIYPLPARSSRKITMTIHQLLKEENGRLTYDLPLMGADSIANFNLSVSTGDCHARPVASGFLSNHVFSANGKGYQLSHRAEKMKLPLDLSFSIATRDQTTIAVKQKDDKKFFALRFTPQEMTTKVNPEKLLVYWDASLSASKRDIAKEVSFLKSFVQSNQVKEITIMRFSSQPERPEIFSSADKRWERFLFASKNEGATRLDQLNFSPAGFGALLVFSDGHRTIGYSPGTGRTIPVFTVTSAIFADTAMLKFISGKSGGSFINLAKQTIPDAIKSSSEVRSDLLSIVAGSPDTKFQIHRTESSVLVYGTFTGPDVIRVSYGNYKTLSTDQFILSDNENGAGVDRIPMLLQYPGIQQWSDWNRQLDFGLEEQVVTARTSFIVLERVEDYIRYNIAPPKELEEECRERGFVKQSTREQRAQQKKQEEYDKIAYVMNAYNSLLLEFGVTAIPVTITRESFEDHRVQVETKTRTEVSTALTGQVPGMNALPDAELSEVVVTSGYGIKRASREIGYATDKISYKELTQTNAFNVQSALTGKVSGLNVTTVDNSVFENTRLTLRGIRSLTGNNQPLLVVDGSVVPLTYLNSINPKDIQDVTVLKGATAAAIFGSDGVNGVIVVTGKQYRGNSTPRKYRLIDMPEEDYIQHISAAPMNSKLSEYHSLKNIHGHKPLFYVEMAMYLYNVGFTQKAKEVLLNAAEIANAEPQTMRSIAFVLEEWNEYDDAISIYSDMKVKDHQVIRDLAWAYYRSGRKQQAIDLINEWITNTAHAYYEKAYLVDDMNAMIAMEKSLVTDHIHKELIVAKPVDLRIVLSTNTYTSNNMRVQLPAAKSQSVSYAGGYYSQHLNVSQFKNAEKGKYKVSVYQYNANTFHPVMVKMMIFKNFGKPDQSIEVRNLIMNNQQGYVEIGEVKW